MKRGGIAKFLYISVILIGQFTYIGLVRAGGVSDTKGVLVRYKSDSKRGGGLSSLTLQRPEGLVSSGVYRIPTSPLKVQEQVEQLNRDPEVYLAEPDYSVEPSAIPDDPFMVNWNEFYNYDLIKMEEAWDINRDCTEVVVAILDSGVSQDHPDLSSNLWFNANEIPANGIDDDENGYVDDANGYDFFDDDGRPQDVNGHGTAIAGIIGAVAENNIGMSGLCWRAQILPLRIFGGDGKGPVSAALEAIDYAIAQGARVINMSWTLEGGQKSTFLEDAIRKGNDYGVLFVAAAGNNGKDLDVDPVYPASYDLPNLLAVAAEDQTGHLADFSNYGAETINLAAPGVSVMTTGLGGVYTKFTGTSAAAPHVSGAAALALSMNSGLSPETLRDLLTNHVEVQASLSALVSSSGSLDVLGTLSSVGSAPTFEGTPDDTSSPSGDVADSGEPASSEGQFNSSGGGCSLIPE